MHAGKLGQVTNFTIVGGTAKHCVDQYMVLFCYCPLRGDTAKLGELYDTLCHAFFVHLFDYCVLSFAISLLCCTEVVIC